MQIFSNQNCFRWATESKNDPNDPSDDFFRTVFLLRWCSDDLELQFHVIMFCAFEVAKIVSHRHHVNLWRASFEQDITALHFHLLRFSLWLFRYFLKTYVYTPSTPCRDVKFCINIPLGDLRWNSFTEVMWHHQINAFSNSKYWKKTDKKTFT